MQDETQTQKADSATAEDRKLTRREEMLIISEIGNRALDLYADHDIPDDKMTVVTDIDRAHQDIPLNLLALRDCDDLTFAHDIDGIRRHMNRQTGKLENCFVPSTALQYA